MNSPQRELWVYVTKQNKLAKASDIIEIRSSINTCRPAGALDRRAEPTAGAVGYGYFVGFANSLTLTFQVATQKIFSTYR